MLEYVADGFVVGADRDERAVVISNTIAMSPIPAPSSADHQMSLALKLVLPAKPNNGCAPTIDTSVAYATTDAISDGSKAMRRSRASSPKRRSQGSRGVVPSSRRGERARRFR